MAGSLVRYPARVTTLWFVSMIAMGSFFLAMPWSHRSSAHPISWLDACFTATSALCVTGLSVRSTPHDFSFV
ncbi:MAG: Trk family potassium uptake protein, partial [Pirellulaceae bacterium]